MLHQLFFETISICVLGCETILQDLLTVKSEVLSSIPKCNVSSFFRSECLVLSQRLQIKNDLCPVRLFQT